VGKLWETTLCIGEGRVKTSATAIGERERFNKDQNQKTNRNQVKNKIRNSAPDDFRKGFEIVSTYKVEGIWNIITF